MKTQLEKKENTKEEIERKEKDGDERTNQSYLVLPASRSFKKKIRSPSEIVHLLGESILWHCLLGDLWAPPAFDGATCKHQKMNWKSNLFSVTGFFPFIFILLFIFVFCFILFLINHSIMHFSLPLPKHFKVLWTTQTYKAQ